jgi:UDP-glucose 4-epimerase
MRILVTGASGFLGLNLLKHLAESHPQAVLAADLHAPVAEDLDGLGHTARTTVFEALDVRDPEACLRLVVGSGATHIVHAAAVTLTEETVAAVDLTRDVNLQGAENILAAAKAAKTVQQCLLVSSSGVYCQSGGNPSCGEDDPLQLNNEYASSKRAAELRMHSYEAAGGFVVAAARVSPVYGPFERRRDTRPRISLICRLLDFLLDGRPIRIGGTDFSRDWTHAADIAGALEAVLSSPRLNHRIYNVGSGSGVSAREIIAIFIEAGLEVRWTDASPDIFLDPRDSRKPLAIERLQHDTGFAPRFDIRAGISDTIAAESARRTAGNEIHWQEKQRT